jgi:hypothetical protein
MMCSWITRTMSETVITRVGIRLRLRSHPSPSMAAVLENEDLLAMILQKAELAPRDFVRASRVSRGWHDVCMRNGTLALQAARTTEYLTKRALMGLLALSSQEADRLPRATKPRRGGGVMYLYPVAAVDRAWEVVGGADAWRSRLRERSSEQQAIEVVFGTGWRELRWPGPKRARFVGSESGMCVMY